jgi:DNA-binding transcriptional regulator YiaG
VTNHPNRSRRQSSPAANPTPAEIRQARLAAGLTQTEAASLIYCTLRAWQDWEAGKKRMHPAFWELWHVKAIANEHALPDQTPQPDEAIEHDPWFRAQVAQGLDEADDQHPMGDARGRPGVMGEQACRSGGAGAPGQPTRSGRRLKQKPRRLPGGVRSGSASL